MRLAKNPLAMDEPPLAGFHRLHQIALIDRNKWNEKRYLSFDLADIFPT